MRNKQNQSLNANSSYQCVAYNRLFLNTRSKRQQSSLHQISTSFENASKNKPSKSKTRDKQSSKNKVSINNSQKFDYSKDQKFIKSNQISHQNSAVKHDFSKNRQDNRTFRKLQLTEKQNRMQSNGPKSFTISIDQSKLFEERPHYSQNLKSKAEVFSSQPTNRKLYTFCGQTSKQYEQKQKITIINEKETKETEQYSEKNINQSQNSSTIIVKEEQLKRFTQKFARQKIQFEQSLLTYANQINNYKLKNNNLMKQKYVCTQKLNHQQKQIRDLQQQIQTTKQQLRLLALRRNQSINQLQMQLKEKDIKIEQLQKLVSQKESKINEILQQLSRRQRQIQKIQNQNNYSKMVLPVSNINHIFSINSQVYTEQISKQMLQQIQFFRSQCIKYQHEQMQTNKSLAFLTIQNQHLSRQLELQKQTVLSLRQQIAHLSRGQKSLQIKYRNSMQRSFINELHPNNIMNKQSMEILHQQITDLLSQNAALATSKQTLQRSLKVSSQMILHLKQQVNALRNKYQNQIITKANVAQKQKSQITLDHVKTIIRLMMKDQLELQDKLEKFSEHGAEVTKPILQNKNLKRYYEEGYQSVRQNQNTKQKHCKTEQYSSKKDKLQSNVKYMTQGPILDEVNRQISPFNSHLHFQSRKSDFSALSKTYENRLIK